MNLEAESANYVGLGDSPGCTVGSAYYRLASCLFPQVVGISVQLQMQLRRTQTRE